MAQATAQAPAETAEVPAAEAVEGDGRVWCSESVPGLLARRLVRPGPGSVRRMYRHVLLPWYWAGGMFAVLACAVGLAQQSDHAAARPGATLAVAVCAAVGVWALPAWLRATSWARVGTEAHWARTQPGHTVLAALGVAVWALGTTAAWPATPRGWLAAAAVLVLGTAAAGARYWQHHRHHTPVVNPGRTLSAAPTGRVREDAGPADLCRRVRERWAERVQPEGGLLPGAALELAPTEAGGHGVIRLVGGRQDLATLDQVRGKLASALAVSSGLISYSEHEPDTEAEPDPAVIDFAVMSAQVRRRVYPLADHPRVNPRPPMVTLTMGGMVDGAEMAEYLLYDEAGIRSGYVTGTTGAGKSMLVESLALGALETGVTALLYLDPKGNSSPRLAEAAHIPLASDDPRLWRRLIQGVLEGMSARKALVQAGELTSSEFHPGPEFPGVLLVVEECHNVTALPDLRDGLGIVAREGRSLGVGLLMASQGYTAGTFGGSTDLRRDTTQANCVALKLDKDHGNSFAADFGMNPKNLPDPTKIKKSQSGQTFKPNAGFALSKSHDGRMMRTLFSSEETRAELIRAARARGVRQVDPVTYGAIDAGSGHMLSRAQEEREQMRAAAADRLQHYRALAAAAQNGTPPPAHPSSGPAQDTAAGGGSSRPAAPVIDLAALREGRAEAAPHREPTRAEAAVLDALAEHGPLGTTALADVLDGVEGCSMAGVKRALAALAREGRITKHGGHKGRYEITDRS